jgi:hypothetical protein
MLPPCQAILALISKLYLSVFVQAAFDGRAAAQSLFTATAMIPSTRSAASGQASSLEFLAAYDERISL